MFNWFTPDNVKATATAIAGVFTVAAAVIKYLMAVREDRESTKRQLEEARKRLLQEWLPTQEELDALKQAKDVRPKYTLLILFAIGIGLLTIAWNSQIRTLAALRNQNQLLQQNLEVVQAQNSQLQTDLLGEIGELEDYVTSSSFDEPLKQLQIELGAMSKDVDAVVNQQLKDKLKEQLANIESKRNTIQKSRDRIRRDISTMKANVRAIKAPGKK